MPDKKVTVLDILARIEELERRNETLEQQVTELKAQHSPENWQDLVVYKANGSETPVEISWTDIETKEKIDHYLDSRFHSRTIIGQVRRV
jgi:hypothetical protein